MALSNKPRHSPETGSPAANRRVSVLAWAAGVGLILVLSGLLLHGKTGMEKTLTALTFPLEAAWLLLTGWMCSSLSSAVRNRTSRQQLLIPVLLWSLFTGCGTPLLGDACHLYLESLERPFDLERDSPLDLLVVLGGSTSQGPHRAEVGESGDRVLLAAQMYFQGKARRLLTTGSDLLPGFGPGNSPAQQTTEIWTALGIPATDIETLAGINTYAEMQALKVRMAEASTPAAENSIASARIGLLTSAWHLPRAMRLARAAGMQTLIPVAADHKQRTAPRPLWDYIPSAGSFLRLERCQRELMARLVSR